MTDTYAWGRRPADVWARVPAWVIYHPKVNGTALRLYAHLALNADWTTGEYANPQADIARELGIGGTTVYRAARTLADAGAISIEPTVDAAGDPGPNRYIVHWTRPAGPEDEPDTFELQAPPVPDLQGGPTRNEGTPPRETEGRVPPEMKSPPLIQKINSQPPAAADAKTENAIQAARTWGALVGIPTTKPVLAKWVPAILDWLDATGNTDVPDGFMAGAAQAGIRYPTGWAYYDHEGQTATSALAEWTAEQNGDN